MAPMRLQSANTSTGITNTKKQFATNYSFGAALLLGYAFKDQDYLGLKIGGVNTSFDINQNIPTYPDYKDTNTNKIGILLGLDYKLEINEHMLVGIDYTVAFYSNIQAKTASTLSSLDRITHKNIYQNNLLGTFTYLF